MPLDLARLSQEERQTYLDLGRRYDPEVALAQADSTLQAFTGSMRELMNQGFLFEDHMTLTAARKQLDELLHGGQAPVDPDTLPVLAGILITLAHEAEKAAQEAARAAHHLSQNIGDLLIVQRFKVVARPKEGCEPELKKSGSLQELFVLAAEDERRANALRELRRARERAPWKESESEPPPPEEPEAAPYRAAPHANKAASRRSNKQPGPTPEQIAWAKSFDACKKERSEHGRSVLKSAALLALGVGGLVVVAEWDSEGHTQANSKLAAMGFLLAVVSFFGLIRSLVRLVVTSQRLSAIARQEPVERRW